MIDSAPARAAQAVSADDRPVFSFHGEPSPGLAALAEPLKEALTGAGYRFDEAADSPRLVLNFITEEAPAPFRRRAQAVFVLSLLELPELPEAPVKALYPYLVRSLSNMLLVYTPGEGAHFVTLELGHYVEGEGPRFAERLVERIKPLAESRLVIDNDFREDLEEALHSGDALTRSLSLAGKRLADWDLLPAPFSIEEILSKEDLRHVKRLYGIGGLSYGNLSVRKDEHRFWMSASGVDKSRLSEVGRDILMVTDYDEATNAMCLSVPPGVEPRRVSVDAIEHWMIYREHPSVQAIIHVHAWMDGVPSTELNYPCGTYELAEAVADKLRRAADPSRAIIGLKNHGLTITGRSVEDILARIEGKLVQNIPMT